MLELKALQTINTLVTVYNIEVDIRKDAQKRVYADLNTRAKSYMHLYETHDGKLMVRMRYDREFVLDDNKSVSKQLAELYTQCIHGRSFGSEIWDQLCANHGIKVEYGNL